MTEPNDKLFQMRTSDTFLAKIDDWRTQQRPVPSRAEAVRQLVEIALGGAKRKPARKT